MAHRCENVYVLLPGEESDLMQPPYVCAFCMKRPVFCCHDCGALVCADHAGKLCEAVLGDGRRCTLGCVPGRHHTHTY